MAEVGWDLVGGNGRDSMHGFCNICMVLTGI